MARYQKAAQTLTPRDIKKNVQAIRRRTLSQSLEQETKLSSAMSRPPRVFISYSHDSDAHREHVLALSERLRQDGVETILDRYVKGSPPEGWPRWMMNGLDAADRILLICTPTYYRRFRGFEEPGKGKGVDWEGAIVTQELYHARSSTTRFIPVIFDTVDEASIPEPLRGQSWYCLTSEATYNDLYDVIIDQAGVEPGALGVPKRKPRDRGEPLRFGQAKGSDTHEPKTASSGAVAIWQEKLEFLLEQEAVMADPVQLFQLRKHIDECRAKLQEFRGSAPDRSGTDL